MFNMAKLEKYGQLGHVDGHLSLTLRSQDYHEKKGQSFALMDQ